MKINRVLISALACIMGLFLCGCGKSSCTLNVASSYSGWGIDGQDLGSGSFVERLPVSDGDVLYEDSSGHWIKDGKNVFEEIISINEIGENGVTVTIGMEELTLSYNSTKRIESKYVVCDGINYSYTISFTRNDT